MLNLPQPTEYYLFNDRLRKRHERASPPKEAYLYFPKERDIIEYNPTKPDKTLRRIFSGVDFNEYENSKLAELYKEILKREIVIPGWWEESETRRFLQATQFNINKTIIIIEQQIIWCQSYFPLNITNKTISILNSGFMYIHGRDKHFRPVFVIQAAIYFRIRELYSYDEIFLAIIYFLEYILHNLLILGQVENWITITDLTNVSIVFMPRDLKRLSEALSSCYRCRLYKNYILGLSPGITWLYKLATSFVDEVILQKLCVVEKNRWDVIRDNINEDNYEEKFGGNAPNINHRETNSYFPPVMPSDNYGIPQEENFLITEIEYKERCGRNDKLKPVEIGQYFTEKWLCETMAQEKEREKENQIQIMNDEPVPIVEIKKMKTLYSKSKWTNDQSKTFRNAKTTVEKEEWSINDESKPGDDDYKIFSSLKLFNGLSNMININSFNNTSPEMNQITKSKSKLNALICKETASDITDLVKV